MGDESVVRYTVTVVARDRVGIIADVTDILFELGANLEALSQTVVWGYFTMTICAAFPPGTDRTRVKEAVESSGEFSCSVLPFEHVAGPQPDGEPFVATIIGDDKPGIVRRLTRCFADRGINIDDVWNEVKGGRFVVIFHVTVPRDLDVHDIRYELEQMAQDLNVILTLQHRDIFTATNSLSVHTPRPGRW